MLAKGKLLRSPISRAVVLATSCLLAISPFFFWGSPSGHDFEFHMFSWMEVHGQWSHGILYPRWAALAHWGYGEARFLFYPPASWTLGAALGSILPWKMVPGAYCWIVLTLAGASMYRLARQWLPAPDALFGAIFYALNPYHLLIVYWRSAYAELLAAPLLPLLLLCLFQIFSLDYKSPQPKPGLSPTLWLSLTLAAAWLTNAPSAVMIYYSTAGLATLLAVSAARKPSEAVQVGRLQVWRPLVRTALAMLLGAGLASFYLVPAIYEQRWISLDQVMSPGVRPQDNFLLTTTADPDHNRFNRLVSTVALVEISVLALAIWFARRARTNRAEIRTEISDRTPWMLLTTWGTACTLLMLSASNLLWEHLPKFRFVQLPFRWLLCLNAALAVLLAMAAKRWTNHVAAARVLASAFLLTAVIVSGHRIQPPWWDTAVEIREMNDALANGTGYEGTDEYVPIGDDPYELNQALPQVSDDAGAAVPARILAWSQIEKHFIVHTTAPHKITVRLFSYPAWDVQVNGKPTPTEKTDVTGLIVIPIAAGDSDITIHFRRTTDRVIGNILSLISLIVFVVAWIRI